MATKTITASGGTRAWSDSATWSPSGAPIASDDVVATGSSGNVTIAGAASCRSINLTNYVGTLTHNAGQILTVGTSTAGPSNNAVVFPSSGWTYSPAGGATIKLASTSGTQQNVNFGGKLTTNVLIQIAGGGGGTWKLTAATGNFSQLSLTAGVLDLNGNNLNVVNLVASGSTTSSLTLGGASVTVGASGISFTGSGFTLSAGTSSITCSGAISGNSQTFYDVVLSGTNQTISGSNTFHSLTKTVAAAATLTITDGTTQTVTAAVTLQGASGQLLTLQGTSTAGWTIAAPATQTLSYLDVSYCTSTGNTLACGATSQSTNGNNVNVTFGSGGGGSPSGSLSLLGVGI